jgi:O-antigen/teichoic acid export membrane protein
MFKSIRSNIISKSQSLLARSLVLNSLDYAIQIAAMFVVTPAMVKGLGQDGYGQWLILMAVIGYLPLLEAGVASAGVKFLAAASKASDTSLFARRLGAIHRWLWRAGWIAGILLCLLAFIWPWIPTGSDNKIPDATLVFLVFLPSTLLTFWMKERLLVLRAFLRYDLIVATTTTRTIIQTVAVLWVLRENAALPWLALANAIPQALGFLAQHILAQRILNAHDTKRLPPQSEEISELRDISKHVFASQLAMSFSGRAEPFMVNAVASIEYVPLHGIARRFTSLFADAYQTIFGAVLTTSFSTLAGAGKIQQMHNEFARRSRFVATLAGGGCATLYLMSPPFLAVWLPPSFGSSANLLNLVLPGLALRMAAIPASALLLATNRHGILSKLSWKLCIINLFGMMTLGSYLGIKGIFLAIGGADILMFGYLLPFTLSVQIKNIFSFYVYNTIMPLLAGCVIAMTLSILGGTLLTHSYGRLGIFASIVAASVVAFASYLGTSKEKHHLS